MSQISCPSPPSAAQKRIPMTLDQLKVRADFLLALSSKQAESGRNERKALAQKISDLAEKGTVERESCRKELQTLGEIRRKERESIWKHMVEEFDKCVIVPSKDEVSPSP